MKNQIIYFFTFSLVLLLCWSCSQEDTSTMEEPQVVKLQLEFETSTENELEGASFETHHLEIISTSPLIIESETLEVVEIEHPLTEEIVELIVPKRNNQESINEDPCKEEFSEVFVYHHNTKCIYFWGTRVQWEDCSIEWFPAKMELKYCFGKMHTYY
ncbi:hypothetical protein [Flagellimonas sp.]|uniref:hypothetical protein n=1 Tax=Flagellimonas sp. TaxID=2058762 RepID=UPI003BAE915F